MPLAEDERTDLLALLRDLTAGPVGRTVVVHPLAVRDVATHVVSYDELSISATVATFLRGGLRSGRSTTSPCDRYRNLDPAGIIELVARHLQPERAARRLQGRHRADRRHHPPPGHQESARPAARLSPRPAGPRPHFSLGAPPLPSKGNAKGLRLVATDVDWSAVTGPDHRARRGAPDGRRRSARALDDLSGDGLPTLRQRVAWRAHPERSQARTGTPTRDPVQGHEPVLLRLSSAELRTGFRSPWLAVAVGLQPTVGLHPHTLSRRAP